jgi:hypothetical protein
VDGDATGSRDDAVREAALMMSAQLGIDPDQAERAVRAHSDVSGVDVVEVARQVLERQLFLGPIARASWATDLGGALRDTGHGPVVARQA